MKKAMMGCAIVLVACSSAAPDDQEATETSDIVSWKCGDSEYKGHQYWTCVDNAIHRCDANGVPQVKHCANGCIFGPLGTNDHCNTTSDDAWASAVLARAQSWVDQGVMYSHDPSYAGYRTDCSGLVSYAWGLPPPGHVTYTFAGGARDDGVSYEIGWEDLRPGDALNFGGNESIGTGHILLFAAWADSSHYSFYSYEEEQPGLPAQYLKHTKGDDWNYGIGTIGQIYVPIRSRSRGGAPPSSSWSCADSDYNGQQIWTCVGSVLHRCSGGAPQHKTCANGCIVEPLGVNDVCR